ncbi:MAG: hypothetical protein Pg6C_19080 [Treponemataceae bacterium]|nr:MAG: hypothetical protein Pg6C_18630 [Treponemataceae bacterium]GMO53020.1 MAG: hypothetical protein Pg6C_19080 [Treponemataceae bacterium]
MGRQTARIPFRSRRNCTFFFDRTASMRGFTANGDASEYITALPVLWTAADVTFPNLDAHFYEYGETYTNEFKSLEAISVIKKELLLGEFYGGVQKTGGIRTQIKLNGGQPFTSIAAYTKTLDGQDALFVIVTDLYEQNLSDPFSSFYRDAFARGLSGAFFAVESSFSGTINSVSRVDVEGKSVPVRNGGRSTFFICIAGDSAVVSAYCAALAKEMSAQKLFFDSAVFITKPDGKQPLFFAGDPALGGTGVFQKPENAVRRVNILPQQITVLDDAQPSQYESYQIRNDYSRWSAGLFIPTANVNPQSFAYKAAFALSHSEGASGKRGEQKEPARFAGISGIANITAKVTLLSEIPETAGADSAYPLYFTVETKNRNLAKGWHKVEYEVVPEAIPNPGWISELNAGTISALEESAADGGRVKTLQLAIVYERIADAYNKTKSRGIYKDELYIVKK